MDFSASSIFSEGPLRRGSPRDAQVHRLNELFLVANMTEEEAEELRLLLKIVRLRSDLVLAEFELAGFMSAKGHQNTHCRPSPPPSAHPVE